MICKQCGKEKDKEKFPNKPRKDGSIYYGPTCRLCISNNWVERHPGQQNFNQRQYDLKRRTFVFPNKRIQLFNAIGQHKCSKCPEDDLRVLQFHHEDPLQKEVKMDQMRFSLEKLIEEAKKCIILCANCHIKEHHVWTKNYESLSGVKKIWKKGQKKKIIF